MQPSYAPDGVSRGDPPIDLTQRPGHAPDVVDCEVLDELVLFSAGTSSAVALNASARAVWELCDGQHRVGDICDELAQIAGLTGEAIRDDVLSALATFRRLGLLRP